MAKGRISARPFGPGIWNAWRIAWRPCSIEVLARAGNPITSPTA